MNTERLLKLADFLDRLPPTKWEYGAWVEERGQDIEPCGTVCCAIGWMPAVDPANWRWLNDVFQWPEPVLKGHEVDVDSRPQDSAAEYFNIGIDIAEAIFVDAEQFFRNAWHTSLQPCDIANLIRYYVTNGKLPKENELELNEEHER